MNCNVIKDLMPQYADGCVSEESRALIEEHIKSCESCKRELGEVIALFGEAAAEPEKTVPEKIEQERNVQRKTAPQKSFELINIRKAALIQSALLYGAFLLIVLGVWREASTPSGALNGLWGISLVVPATAFLLSLVNWYFVRFYASKKVFSCCSLGIYLAFLALCFIWAALHYGSALKNLFAGSPLSAALPVIGILLAAALGALSYLGSAKYAALLGKQ
ncbi:MAG: zf-HC2 domain-containing protein [Clostridia bacterium]|nr:zf-HC2 domain-containing protein [Clostridia bacterium]